MKNAVLSEASIRLHEVARMVEAEVGTCRISIEIRRAADALAELAKGETNGQ